MNMNGYKINNMPTTATSKKAIIGRIVDDNIWYFGAYNDIEKAEKIVNTLENGILILNPNA